MCAHTKISAHTDYKKLEGTLHVTIDKHTSGQVYCSERVTFDSGKPRNFLLCKMHEFICSNQARTQGDAGDASPHQT